MKKTLSVILLLFIGLLALSGCSTSNEIQENNNGNLEDDENVETQSTTNEETSTDSIPEPPRLPED